MTLLRNRCDDRYIDGLWNVVLKNVFVIAIVVTSCAQISFPYLKVLFKYYKKKLIFLFLAHLREDYHLRFRSGLNLPLKKYCHYNWFPARGHIHKIFTANSLNFHNFQMDLRSYLTEKMGFQLFYCGSHQTLLIFASKNAFCLKNLNNQ